jgi:hypothetical protein
MGVPYEAKPQVNVSVAASPVVLEFAWPDKSVISKIIVVQTDGVAENFTVVLYNHSQVMTGEATSDSEDPVGKIPDDCYRVTDDIVSPTPGKLLYFSDRATGSYGFVFKSQEDLAGRQGQSVRKVYLKITPAGSGNKKFAVTIGGMKEVE